MMIVPDTSVWIDYLRHGTKGKSAALDELLKRGNVMACGPVVAEVLTGARQSDRHELWDQFRGLPWTPLSSDQWHEVGDAAAKLREGGASVPLTDVVIATSARAADATLWTRDSDFQRINQTLGWPEVAAEI